MLKSELRKTIEKVLEDHEVEDGDLRDDLIDQICLLDEVVDDED